MNIRDRSLIAGRVGYTLRGGKSSFTATERGDGNSLSQTKVKWEGWGGTTVWRLLLHGKLEVS